MQAIPKAVKVTIPEVGEVEFPVFETPALKQLVEAAQGVEKEKLYQTIEGLKQQVKDKEDTIQSTVFKLTEAEQKLATTSQPDPVHQTQSANSENKATVETHTHKPNPDTLTREAINAVVKEGFDSLVENYLKPLQTTISALQKENLEEYRERRLAQLGKTVIPELVKGNTKEEIEQSIQSATEFRKKYVPIEEAALPTPPAPPAPVPPAAPPVLKPRFQPQDQNGTKKLAAEMTLTDFASSREEMLAGLKDDVAEYSTNNSGQLP